MAVIDDSLKQQAKELWLQGKKYKEISEITGIKESTIKSLASRIWKKEKLQPNKKKVATKVAVANKDKGTHKMELLPEEIETLANEELTVKQRLFCLYYVRWFNATKAYQKAYGCDYFTALANGPRLLGNARIKEEIQAIKDAKIKQSMYNAEDLFQKMVAIAYSDATDFMTFGRRINEKTGVEYNYVDFIDSSQVDGTLIQEVKQGKDGVSIKLVSKEFALKWLDKHYSDATPLQKAQLDQIQAQTDKITGNNAEVEDLYETDEMIYGKDCKEKNNTV